MDASRVHSVQQIHCSVRCVVLWDLAVGTVLLRTSALLWHDAWRGGAVCKGRQNSCMPRKHPKTSVWLNENVLEYQTILKTFIPYSAQISECIVWGLPKEESAKWPCVAVETTTLFLDKNTGSILPSLLNKLICLWKLLNINDTARPIILPKCRKVWKSALCLIFPLPLVYCKGLIYQGTILLSENVTLTSEWTMKK